MSIPPPVRFFLLLAFGISWGAFYLRRAFDWPEAAAEGPRLTIKFGPSLAGLLAALRYGGASGMRNLVARLNPLRAGVGWVALALLAPIGILLTALGLRALLGGGFAPAEGLAAGAASCCPSFRNVTTRCAPRS